MSAAQTSTAGRTTPNADMKAAKKIKGDVLVWWPIVEMDDEGNLTDKVKGGAWIVTQYLGNCWNGPDQVNSIGEWFGDDDCYASEPTHWLPVPPDVSNEQVVAALAATKTGGA